MNSHVPGSNQYLRPLLKGLNRIYYPLAQDDDKILDLLDEALARPLDIELLSLNHCTGCRKCGELKMSECEPNMWGTLPTIVFPMC